MLRRPTPNRSLPGQKTKKTGEGECRIAAVLLLLLPGQRLAGNARTNLSVRGCCCCRTVEGRVRRDLVVVGLCAWDVQREGSLGRKVLWLGNWGRSSILIYRWASPAGGQVDGPMMMKQGMYRTPQPSLQWYCEGFRSGVEYSTGPGKFEWSLTLEKPGSLTLSWVPAAAEACGAIDSCVFEKMKACNLFHQRTHTAHNSSFSQQ